MFDDYIRSRLLKDQKYYKENRDQLGNKYPWERAEKFNQEIKKLHGFDDGSSLMDKFRELITEIGNALGFVRMIRAGGLNYCSAAIGLVPNLQKIPSFVEQTKDEPGLSKDTQQAAENIDEVIADLVKKFAEVVAFFFLQFFGTNLFCACS
jgi:WASH complex subunit 7